MASLTRILAAAALALALPAAATRAHAQSDPAKTPINLDAIKLRDQELDIARADQKRAAETERKLRVEIEQFGNDRRKLNQALLDTAAKIRGVETQIAATEARLRPLEAREQALRQSLEERRGVIAEVLAALQRMGRKPPPAMIARPEDALQSVRAAILLGSVLPEMRERAQALAADLGNLVGLRESISAEKAKLSADLAALSDEKPRMNALVEQRQKQQAEAEKALETERQRASILARQVDNLKDLIARLEQGLDKTTRDARRAERAGSDDHKSEIKVLAALKDPGRLEPAMSFASAQGRLPLPAAGVRVRDYGASDGLGGVEKGISVVTRAGAQITAPCDGWVVYSGPFRSYGQLLILNAGGGYHVLLAGMERISVDLGQFVLIGEPVATMGSGAQMAASLPIGFSQPILYIEFRKDGVPVDSSPWWATGEGEKARG